MRQCETIKTSKFYFIIIHFLLLSHFKPTGACDSLCHTMMSSYEEQCSLTSTPGREAYRHRASGPERSDGHTDRSNTRSILLLLKRSILILTKILILILKDTKINTPIQYTNKNINNKTNYTNWLLIMFTCVLLRQPRHSYVCVRVLAMAISPHRLHT